MVNGVVSLLGVFHLQRARREGMERKEGREWASPRSLPPLRTFSAGPRDDTGWGERVGMMIRTRAEATMVIPENTKVDCIDMWSAMRPPITAPNAPIAMDAV